MIDVFFDMDGVLANFNKAADAIQKDRGNNKPFDELNDEEKAKVKAFWSKVEERGPSFWADMEPIPQAVDLLNMLAEHKKIRLFVLSSLPKTGSELAKQGKEAFLEKNFSGIFDGHFFTIGKPKGLFVRNQFDILIDDRISNVKNWQYNGGIGLLFTNNTYNIVVDTLSQILSIAKSCANLLDEDN